MKNELYNLSKIVIFCLAVFASGCKDKDDTGVVYTFEPSADIQAEVQEALINMPDKSTIKFAAGTFEFASTLSMEGKKSITIEGAGRTETILSFAGQIAGAEGIKITNANWFLIRNLTVQDTKGDAIKINDSDGVSMIGVGAVWSGDPSEDNGAYGLYPVLCSNILIDNCYVKGASDAGIYVGQSDRAIVRNSTAELNVAGIEIENTTNADVYNNTATLNTGGILIFDLPDLSQTGRTVRVFNNDVINNQHPNFAPAGNIVASVPAGTGIMVMSTKEVEIFNNTITENNIMGVGVVSYSVLVVVGGATPPGESYDPFCKGINIHNNTFSKSGIYPADNNDIGDLLSDQFPDPGSPIPNIFWDGFEDKSDTDPGSRICIRNNTPEDFVNLDGPGFFNNKSFDLTPHDCAHDQLPAVVVDAPGI